MSVVKSNNLQLSKKWGGLKLVMMVAKINKRIMSQESFTDKKEVTLLEYLKEHCID